MSIKNLFKDYKSNQFKPTESELSSSKKVESAEFLQNKITERNVYVPVIDFSTASNFAKFGSAELYYEFAFKRIYQQYPYDGSLAEKQEFRNNSTFLDKYIFDYVYPKSAGHVIFSSEGWGTRTATDNDYGQSNNTQYISVLGGPHTASSGMEGKELSETFDNSMIYDVSKGRVGSFEWNPTSGSTIEFWMKKDAWLDASLSKKEVILDIWNGEAADPSKYGRITLELANVTGNDPLLLTMRSGSDGFNQLSIANGVLTSGDIDDNKWHHYAVSIENVGTTSVINLYRDGRYLKTTTNSGNIQSIKNVDGGVNAYIGALQTAVTGTATGTGWGKLSASLDEFRYWKKKRSTNEIGEFWFMNMGGGTNKREYNTDLGLYFKFNEGITLDNSIDSITLDYSGRISNGSFVGYVPSARSTVSAIDSLVNVTEEKDVIIYSSHPDVSSSLATYRATGSIQDFENTSLLYHLYPSWIIETDEENGKHLKYLTQIMASYFDTLNAQIHSVTEFKDKRYFSGSLEPNIYSRELLRNQGFVVPDLFIEADVLEEFRLKDDNEIYTKDIQKTKNLIYQNIYNNLNFIYKSKGTEKSFRNFFRCFGVDSELLRLNLYSDGSTYLYKDNYEFTSIAKPVVNFNKEQHLTASVYQSGSSGITFISGSGAEEGKQSSEFTSITFEAEVLFPYKFKRDETGYFPTPFTGSSIAGFHRAKEHDDFTWSGTDTTLNMVAIKQSIDSKNVTFQLSGSAAGASIDLRSPMFNEVYDNNKWILAARVKHEDYPYAGWNVTGSGHPSGLSTGNYIVEFYGVNSLANDVKNEFSVNLTVSNAVGKALLGHGKRIYAGSHRINTTGSVFRQSDVKVSQVRFWQSYLEDNEIKEHSYDPTNYGLEHPYRSNTSFYASSGSINNSMYVPKIETLALHWDFMTVSSSNPTGNFVVKDISSGSITNLQTPIGHIISKKYDGYGLDFMANSTDAVDKEFFYTAKKRLPDEVYSSDGVVIKSEETEEFFQDDAVADHFYSFEKSPYAAVSQQMINFFGSIKDFNSLIGDPAERYRPEYKQMTDLKRLFFEKVENTPDPERFFEYFKWIDTSISYAIKQLIPASSRFSEEVKDVVESHILERNKYQEKFPLTAQQRATEGVVKSFAEMFYNWKFGHAPVDGSDNKNCLWQKTRRRVGNEDVQALRENIYKTSNTKLDRLYDIKTQQVYFGNTDAVRRLTRPFKLDLQLKQNIHGGTNYYVAKNRDYVLEVVHPHGPTSAVGVPKNVLVVGAGAGQGLIAQTACEDGEDGVINKEKFVFDGVDGRFSSDQNNAPISDFVSYKNFTKGIATFPFNIMSQSTAVSTGYQGAVTNQFKDSAYITNLHSDTTDRTNAVPMQGPFTERHIGGHQSRHIRLNKYDTSLFDADFGGQPRFYRTVPGTPTIATLQMLMADLSDGDSLSISDGTTTETYEIDTLANGVTPGRTRLEAHGGVMLLATDFHNSIESSFDIDAHADVNPGTGFLRLTLTAQNTGSNTISFSGVPASMTSNITQVGSSAGAQAFYEYIDNKYTRPEAWRLLLGENPNEPIVDGALGLVPPDYGVSAGTGKYPDIAKQRASYYREEKAKRPINVKNIRHRDSGSTVGNFNKKYEIMMLQGRKENNLYFRDNSDMSNYLPSQYLNSLPHTTHVMGLYGVDPTSQGNTFGQHFNNMQPDLQLIEEAIDGTPASGRFTVTGATISGRLASGSINFTRNVTPATAPTLSFSVKGRTINHVGASGSFVVTASRNAGAPATGRFTVLQPPYYGPAQGIFRVSSRDFVTSGDSVRIKRHSTPVAGGVGKGFYVQAGSPGGGYNFNVSKGTQISDWYDNLKAEIIARTEYNNTFYTETAPVFGKGIFYNGSYGASATGSFHSAHFHPTGGMALSFYVYVSSSVLYSGDIYNEYSNYAKTGGNSTRVRSVHLQVAGGNKYIVYSRYYNTAGPTPVTASWKFPIAASSLDKWSHVWIAQVPPAGTTANAAVPGTGDKTNGLLVKVDGADGDPGLSFVGVGIDSITSIPISSGEYAFFTCDASPLSKGYYGGLDEFALWNEVLPVLHSSGNPMPTVMYNNGVYKAPNTLGYNSNLKAWWRFGDDGFIELKSPPYDSDNTGTVTNNDLLYETMDGQNATASESGTQDLYLVDSVYETTGSALFYVRRNMSVTGGYTAVGLNYTGSIELTSAAIPSFYGVSSPPFLINSTFITNPSTTITEGHTITIDGETFELDSNGSVTGANRAVLYDAGGAMAKTTFWDNLTASIKTHTVYDTVSIVNLVNEAEIRLTSSTNGTGLNVAISNSGASFKNLSGFSGATNDSGATDGHFITIDGVKFELDHDSSVSETSTHRSINSSVGVSNSTFWNELSTEISTNTPFTTVNVADNGNGTATFSITASSGGDGRNGVISTSGASFPSFVQTAGGVDQSGSIDDHRISLQRAGSHIRQFRLDSNGVVPPAANRIYVTSSTATDVQFWNNLSSAIGAEGFGVSYSGGGGVATFVISSPVLGTAGNLPTNSSLFGSTFAFIGTNGFSGGLDAIDNNDGNKITIDDKTFELDSNGSVTGTNIAVSSSTSLTVDQVFNNFKTAVIDNTDFDTISITGTGDARTIHITSSVTGSNYNGKISSATGNFAILSQTAGGLYESGAENEDRIQIQGKLFRIDDNNSESDTSTNKYINSSPGTSNSVFWNRLSQSIKDHTDYDIITITAGSGTALFELTSSVTGSVLNTQAFTSTEVGGRTTFSGLSGFVGGSDFVPAVFTKNDIVLAVPTPLLRNGDRNETIITTRFAAPGGPEIECAGYLDVFAREYSVHNGMPFRNLTVKSNSGENNTIRVNDHLDKRRGLNTLLTNHSGKFGLDSNFGVRRVTNFEGDNSFINIGAANTWNALIGTAGTKKMTLAAWINVKTTSPEGRLIFDFGNSDLTFFVDDERKLRFASRRTGVSGLLQWQTTSVLSLNSWVHVAVTYDANDITNDPILYLNAVPQSISHVIGSKINVYYGIVTQDCFIGNRNNIDSEFEGKISDAAIWNRVLPQSDIELIYNSGVASGLEAVVTDVDEDLQLWYEMGGGSDTRSKFFDKSNNDKHSTGTNEIDFSNYIEEDQPSFHKVHRNTSYRLASGSSVSSPALEKIQNNAFFSTPIPASDFQYSWIDATLRTENGIDSGHQNHYKYSPESGFLSSSAGYVEAIIFPSSSNIT